MRRSCLACALFALLAVTGPLHAEAPPAAGLTAVDRTVVRFVASELGGSRAPRFITARVLAFEARLEALSDPDHRNSGDPRPYLERHVRAALERHVAETVLSNLRIDPAPTRRELDDQTAIARRILADRVGGEASLSEAARAEGLAHGEVLTMLRRQARASFYLDRMVMPMLAPSDAELRAVHRSVETPFAGLSFEEARPALRRWYVSRRMSVALESYFQSARARIAITVL